MKGCGLEITVAQDGLIGIRFDCPLQLLDLKAFFLGVQYIEKTLFIKLAAIQNLLVTGPVDVQEYFWHLCHLKWHNLLLLVIDFFWQQVSFVQIKMD